MPEFLRQNQDVDVELRLYSQGPLQSQTTADVVVTVDSVKAGFEAFTLFEETLVAAGSADMAQDETALPLRFITTDFERHFLAEDWRDFSAETGLDYAASATNGMMRVTHYQLAMALAQASVGAALVPDFLSADALRNGDLKLISPTRIFPHLTYKLCCKTSCAADAELKHFVRWLENNMGKMRFSWLFLSSRKRLATQALG
jgi:LysR family transcriptional regulator, glycine cleavage system transcriptional activator